MNEVYITRIAKFLPNEPVSNEEMEDYLGMINKTKSRSKNIVLRNNGIKRRYYAIDKTGKITHTNAEIAAEAVKGLLNKEITLEDIDLLACATSVTDQLLPSHASMIHGRLGGKPLDIIAPAGGCCTGMHALKYAYMSVLTKSAKTAVCVASELLSPILRAGSYEEESKKLEELEKNPMIGFEKDFLRWMLSDGAGAVLLQPRPSGQLSLEIKWIESASYANQLDTCMYIGADKPAAGTTKGWKEYSPKEWLEQSIFSMKQDVKILGENITEYGAITLDAICQKRGFKVSEVDFFLPHLSSHFFVKKAEDSLNKYGLHIDPSKWFINLYTVGNVGAASAFLMLEELYNSGKLKPGHKILLMVPESARFSYSYALLSVV